MTFFNPLAGALAQSGEVARQQATDKTAQVRRQQALRKNAASSSSDDRSDSFEHVVESTQEDASIHDRPKDQDAQRRKKRDRGSKTPSGDDSDQPHLDITG